MKDSPMAVGVYPSDSSGCGLYRLAWVGQALADQGKPVIVMPRPPQIIVDNRGSVHNVNFGNLDVVVLQRPASYQYSEMIPFLHAQGKRIVLDMDDSLSKIHPRNAAFKSYDPLVNRKRNWMLAAKACEMADIVTVTTQALADEYGAHGRVEIIPNHIRASYLELQRKENPGPPVVVWAGWTNTHVDDLRVTRGMINQVLVETGAKFAAFGDLNIFRDLGIRNRPPHEHWGFTNILDYPRKLVEADIGLVPLQPSDFNQGKSALKMLEYASLGVVPVVSPTPDNIRLHEMGIGLVATTPREWYDHVKALILDHEMRAEMSKKAREISSFWTIEGNADRWWSAWGKAHRRVL